VSDHDDHPSTHSQSEEDRPRESSERRARYAQRARELRERRQAQEAQEGPSSGPPSTPMGWKFPLMWLIIGLALLIPGHFVQQHEDRDWARMSEQVEGTILNDAHTESHSSCGGGHGCSTDYRCDFSYQFSPKGAATGEAYRGEGSDTTSCGAHQVEGTARTVYYDPGDPEHNTVKDPDDYADRHFGLLLLMIPGSVFTVYALVRFGQNIVHRLTNRLG
jgi:hypothetical protein